MENAQFWWWTGDDVADPADADVDDADRKQVLKGEKVDGAFGTGKTLNSGLIVFDIIIYILICNQLYPYSLW